MAINYNLGKSKGNGNSFLFSVSIVLVIIGIGLFASSIGDTMVGMKKPINLNEDPLESFVPGTRVSGEVFSLLDAFAEMTESTNNGPAKTTEGYYVFPIDDTHAMAFAGKAKDSALYNQMLDETYAYLMGESDQYGSISKQFEGKISEIEDAQLLGWYNEWFVDTQFYGETTADTVSQYAIPYMLEEVNFSGEMICTVGGILLFLGGLAGIIFPTLKKKRRGAGGADIDGFAPAQDANPSSNNPNPGFSQQSTVDRTSAMAGATAHVDTHAMDKTANLESKDDSYDSPEIK